MADTPTRPDVISEYYVDPTTGQKYQLVTGSATTSSGNKAVSMSVDDKTILDAGERQASSATLSYVSVKEDWNYTVVDLSDNSTTVSAAPSIIGNVWVNTVMSAHACPIKDDTITVRSLDASSAVNTEFLGMKGTRFETSLIVDPDDAATGVIVVQWRLI